MARLEVTGPDLRMPGLKGQYQVYRWKGRLVIRAWPRKRPGPLSPDQAEAVAKFKEAALAAKYLNGEEQAVAYEMTKGTQLLPRDAIYQAMYGRLVTIFATSGRVFYSMASWQDVSDVLNIVSNEPWVTLYRGDDDRWHALPPGAADYVLTAHGPSAPPSWEPPPAVGGAGVISGFSMDSNATLQGTGANGKGLMFRTDYDAVVHEVWMRGTLEAGNSFAPIVAEVTSPVANGTFVDVVTGPPILDTVSQAGSWRRLLMTTPVPIHAGLPYFIGQYRTNGLPTTSINLLGSTGGAASIVLPGRNGAFGHFADLTPTPGTAYTHAGAFGAIGIGVIWGNA